MPNRRLPAEWEPQSIVQLTYPHVSSDWAYILDDAEQVYDAIIRALIPTQRVLVVCDDPQRLRAKFTARELQQITLITGLSNDTWVRDYGGITVLEGEEAIVMDFMFNGWGLKFQANYDNLLTRKIWESGHLGDHLEVAGMVLEGGSIESDGQGTILTTARCLDSLNRNPHLDRAAISEHLKTYLGAERVLYLEHGHLLGDDTDAHIDTIARFVAVDTIAYVRCNDEKDHHYEDFKKMEQEIAALRQMNGKPYQLVPLPWPRACHDEDGNRLPATYANFLIANEVVLMPQYLAPQDNEACSILQKLLPNRQVIGINCRPLIEQHGSLHCVTMQYPLQLFK